MLPNELIQKAVRTTKGRILEGWARARTENGLLYYLNHKHGITQWDHPEYIRIFDEMLPINTVKYAAYRTARKLRHLQNRLNFNDVSLQCVGSAFNSAGFKIAENSDVVPVKEVERVILYIYRTAYKSRPLDVSLCTDLMVNLILNTYDENRSGNVQVLKCKVLLSVLCGGRLQEKYRFLFNQIADHNNCCTRRRLAKLLQCLASITELLSEQLSFGVSLVPAAVKSCFKEIEGDIGITEDNFLAWLLQEPQTLVWWTTLYRLSSAEIVCHDIKCNVCKQRPIIGLRYQCLKCLGYNLCQDCFLHGKKSRNHKLTHPIQEYCHESTVKEWRQSIIKIVRHRLTSIDGIKPRYLAISSDSGQTLRSLLQETESDITRRGFERNSRRRSGRVSANGSSSTDGAIDRMMMTSRTICHSMDDLNNVEGGSYGRSASSSSGCEGSDPPDRPEPLILPSSPLQQIHSIIKHLEDWQRELCCGSDDNSQVPAVPTHLVEKYSAHFQTQIKKLQQILQESDPKGDGCKEAARSDRGLPRMESTPIVGDRGLHLSLSPIYVHDTLNDTAMKDNKENHYAETRHCFASCSSTNEGKVPKESRGKVLSNEQQNESDVKDRKSTERLPTFTQLNWSDISHSSLQTLSRKDESEKEGPPLLPLKEEEGKEEGDEELFEAKEELEKILVRLQEMVPMKGEEERKSQSKSSFPTPSTGGVIMAAYEMGDAVADFVERIPSKTCHSQKS